MLNISGITTTAGDFAQTNSCGISLAAGADCTVDVTFTPTVGEVVTGTLEINDDAADSPQQVSLTGSGMAPTAVLSVTALSFGDQEVGTTSVAQAVSLTNGGNSTLTITSIVASGEFAQTNNCGSSVAAGANCTVDVTFTPTAMGPPAGTLTITDNAPNSLQTASVSGQGLAACALASNLSSANVVRGADSATFTVSASTNVGFTGALDLSCSGVSPAQCAFSPASIVRNRPVNPSSAIKVPA